MNHDSSCQRAVVCCFHSEQAEQKKIIAEEQCDRSEPSERCSARKRFPLVTLDEPVFCSRHVTQDAVILLHIVQLIDCHSYYS